jgi:arsenate reductase-like glutaredoxin family protein
MSCTRARKFFEQKRFQVKEEISSRKRPIGEAAAWELVRRASRLVASKGASVREVDLEKSPQRREILSLMLGPTGNLRAPTFIVGSTLYVGFPREGFKGLS